MFITVFYGDYESLLCNPSCTVVNLLDNIKERCGFREMNTELDLTDKTGFVVWFNNHSSMTMRCDTEATTSSESARRRTRKRVTSESLVLELTDHKNDDALKYLTLKGEYILVEKKVTIVESKDPSESSPQQEITYVPLLKRLDEKYPDYVTRVAQRCTTGNQLKQTTTKPKKGKRKKGNE